MSIVQTIARKRYMHIEAQGVQPSNVTISQGCVRALLTEFNEAIAVGGRIDEVLISKSDSELVDYVNQQDLRIFGIPVKATHDLEDSIEVE